MEQVEAVLKADITRLAPRETRSLVAKHAANPPVHSGGRNGGETFGALTLRKPQHNNHPG